MDVSTSDDPMQNISVGNLGEMQAASDNSVGPGPGLPMVIVGSNSNSDHNPYIDDSGRPWQHLLFLSSMKNHLQIFQQES